MTCKQSLLSDAIAPDGNRKRAGSIQHFCFHWTAKCDGSLQNKQKSDQILWKHSISPVSQMSHPVFVEFPCNFSLNKIFLDSDLKIFWKNWCCNTWSKTESFLGIFSDGPNFYLVDEIFPYSFFNLNNLGFNVLTKWKYHSFFVWFGWN